MKAQLIHSIPNPEGSGYLGSPILYKNKLYLRYIVSNSIALAEWNGRKLRFFENPASVERYMGNPIIYKDKLYLLFLNYSGYLQLVAFDGQKLTVIPNPGPAPVEEAPGHKTVHPLNLGALWYPVICNHKMYLLLNVNDRDTFCEFDGEKVSIVPQPSNDFSASFQRPLINHDQLWLPAGKGNDNIQGLAVLENDQFKFVPIWNFYDTEFFNLIAYNSQMCGFASSQYKGTAFFQSDGTSTHTTEIPKEGGINKTVFTSSFVALPGYINNQGPNFPAIVSDKLYNLFLQVNATTSPLVTTTVGEWDGSKFNYMDAINVSISALAPPVAYNNKIYFRTEKDEMAALNAGHFEIVDGTGKGKLTYTGPAAIYNNKFYIGINDRLGVFDGSKVSNLTFDDPSEATYGGKYKGSPILYDRKLFVNMDDALAYVDERNFRDMPQVGDVIIYWSGERIMHSGYVTATEGYTVKTINCWIIGKGEQLNVDPDTLPASYGTWTIYHTNRAAAMDKRLIDTINKPFSSQGETTERTFGITDQGTLIDLSKKHLTDRIFNCHGYTFDNNQFAVTGYYTQDANGFHRHVDPDPADQAIAVQHILLENGYYQVTSKGGKPGPHFQTLYETKNFHFPAGD